MINEKMKTPDSEPVGQMLNSILNTLDVIAGMALRSETADEVAAEEVRLGQVISRAQLILSFTRRPSRRVIQRVVR
jgi:hypothetical protein